jgi:hypothetical protein
MAATARRFVVLLTPPAPNPRFAAASALDAGFLAHRPLTLLHILPAALFITLAPLQFVERIRKRHISLHRWSGRLLLLLGAVIGASALIMSFTMNIGGVSETAATSLFALLFVVFLALGFLNIRRHKVELHRQWMIRTYGVVLGVATTRPIIGAFFAAGRLSRMSFSEPRSGLDSPRRCSRPRPGFITRSHSSNQPEDLTYEHCTIPRSQRKNRSRHRVVESPWR